MLYPKKRKWDSRLKCDRDATYAAGFVDKRSWVHRDGRWILAGEDKRQARREIFVRDGFKCVYCGRSVTWESGHWHHLRRKERVRDDRPISGETACEPCHRQQHGREIQWSRKEKG